MTDGDETTATDVTPAESDGTDVDAGDGDAGDAGNEGGGRPETVPEDPEAVRAAIEADDHALDPEDLQYPTFAFDEGAIGDRGGFDLSREVDYDGAAALLSDLAGGLGTHDLAVESPDGHVRLGVAPEDVEMAFDPDEEGIGEFEVTLTLKAKTMFVADDPDAPAVGARGGRGFVPIEQLTTDREEFRCYNWIEDPTDP